MSGQFVCMLCVNGAISRVSHFDICVSLSCLSSLDPKGEIITLTTFTTLKTRMMKEKTWFRIKLAWTVWSLNIVQQHFPVHFQFTFVFFVILKWHLCFGGRQQSVPSCACACMICVCVCFCEWADVHVSWEGSPMALRFKWKTDVSSWRENEENTGCQTQLITTRKHTHTHTRTHTHKHTQRKGNRDWIHFCNIAMLTGWPYLDKLYKSTRITPSYRI